MNYFFESVLESSPLLSATAGAVWACSCSIREVRTLGKMLVAIASLICSLNSAEDMIGYSYAKPVDSMAVPSMYKWLYCSNSMFMYGERGVLATWNLHACMQGWKNGRKKWRRYKYATSLMHASCKYICTQTHRHRDTQTHSW